MPQAPSNKLCRTPLRQQSRFTSWYHLIIHPARTPIGLPGYDIEWIVLVMAVFLNIVSGCGKTNYLQTSKDQRYAWYLFQIKSRYLFVYLLWTSPHTTMSFSLSLLYIYIHIYIYIYILTNVRQCDHSQLGVSRLQLSDELVIHTWLILMQK